MPQFVARGIGGVEKHRLFVFLCVFVRYIHDWDAGICHTSHSVGMTPTQCH
jgi:hypothetical protein